MPGFKLPANAMELVRNLALELSNYPRITNATCIFIGSNLKGYILQLVTNDDTRFIAGLDKASDLIGEWHDWNELAAITERVLGHGSTCVVLKHVQLIFRRKSSKERFARPMEVRKNNFPEGTFLKNGREWRSGLPGRIALQQAPLIYLPARELAALA